MSLFHADSVSTCCLSSSFPFLNNSQRNLFEGISHRKFYLIFNRTRKNLWRPFHQLFISLPFLTFWSVTFVLETSLTSWFIDGPNPKPIIVLIHFSLFVCLCREINFNFHSLRSSKKLFRWHLQESGNTHPPKWKIMHKTAPRE